MKNSKCRAALVGYGYWGPNLLRNILSHGEFDFVGLVELDENARKRFSKANFHLPVFSDLSSCLKTSKPDAVIIATPPPSHREVAIQALKAGADILVEKPLALSIRECDEILSLAARLGRKVMVDHTFVYNPAVQYLFDSVSQGMIGDLLYYDSVRINLGGFQSVTNVLWDLAPHDLSILDVLTGGKTPISISAVGIKHFDTKVENLCYLNLTYPDKFVAHLNLNWVAPLKIRTVMVGGSKQMIVYDENLPSEKIKIYDKGVSVKRSESQTDFQAQYRIGDMKAPAISTKEALSNMISAFYQYISEDLCPPSDGEAGLRIVSVLEAASLSMLQEGRPIEISSTGSILDLGAPLSPSPKPYRPRLMA